MKRKLTVAIAVMLLIGAILTNCMGCAADTGKEPMQGFGKAELKGFAVKLPTKGF